MRLSTISKDIVAALLPLTTHKRHRTRIAAIEAVRDVMHLVRGWGDRQGDGRHVARPLATQHCWQQPAAAALHQS
jgi:hypothetical protein